MGLSALSFLEQRGNDLCLSRDYIDLDMSEKGAATYWYGMALAKLVAESELSIPWLAHVDRMRASGVLTTSSGSNERGDLVGRGPNNDWHVLEAKGRSHQYSKSLVTSAKGQAGRITAIGGQPPATTSACIASLFAQPISVLLDDPADVPDESGETWVIEDDRFFGEYYQGVIRYLREVGQAKRTIGNTTFVTAPLFLLHWDFFHLPLPHTWEYPEKMLELGLLASIYEAPERASNAIRDLPHDDDGKVGHDGIALLGPMPDWEIA
jgi:hypothetical protein